MKKTNLLKGLGVKLALALVVFSAMLSSCTKENFNLEYKANNAQIYFNPTVIDAASNSLVVGATFTGAETITGNPEIAAGTTTITATYNGVSGQVIVSYGAVPAGSVVTYSPVILLNSEFQANIVSKKTVGVELIKGEGTQGHTHDGSTWNYNYSDYFAKFIVDWDLSRQNKIVKQDIYASSIELMAFIKTLDNVTINVKGQAEYMVSAWSMYRADLYITSEEITYEIVSIATGKPVANITINEVLSQAECKLIEEGIPGHEGHYHAGHGHSGHGGSANAGGGITWAE